MCAFVNDGGKDEPCEVLGGAVAWPCMASVCVLVSEECTGKSGE